MNPYRRESSDPYRKVSLLAGALTGTTLLLVATALRTEAWAHPVFLSVAAGLGALLAHFWRAWVRLRSIRQCLDPERLSVWLSDKDVDARRTALQRLSLLADQRAMRFLVGALAHRDAVISMAAEDALVGKGTMAVETLVGALVDPGPSVREAAARALGRIGDPSAVGPLAGALGDGDASVRHAAAWSLMDLGLPAVQPALGVLIHGSHSARASAAKVLGRLGDLQALQPLIHALGDGHSDVRAVAAEALGRLGDALAVAPLIHALDDSDDLVRVSSATALAILGAAAAPALPMLNRLAKDGAKFSQAMHEIERAVRKGPRELIASEPPEGTGTEPEATTAPEGRGNEPEAAAETAEQEASASRERLEEGRTRKHTR